MGPPRASAYGWAVFAVSFALLLSDYMARQVLNACFPLLKAEWGLSDARLGLLARQPEAARADLAAAAVALGKYFDPAARRTQAAATLLQQVQAQLKGAELPRIDETLAALTTASAGR